MNRIFSKRSCADKALVTSVAAKCFTRPQNSFIYENGHLARLTRNIQCNNKQSIPDIGNPSRTKLVVDYPFLDDCQPEKARNGVLRRLETEDLTESTTPKIMFATVWQWKTYQR